MRGRPGCLLQSATGEVNRILLASALSSMRICPNRVSRHDWIIAVSLGCFVSLHTSSFRNHLMPSSICRYHWSSASILRASVFDDAQQSEPYRNIGKMHVLYSFNFVDVASRDLQIWFSSPVHSWKLNWQWSWVLCCAVSLTGYWKILLQKLLKLLQRDFLRLDIIPVAQPTL